MVWIAFTQSYEHLEICIRMHLEDHACSYGNQVCLQFFSWTPAVTRQKYFILFHGGIGSVMKDEYLERNKDEEMTKKNRRIKGGGRTALLFCYT